MVLKLPLQIIKVALTMVGALLIGFGVPAGWVWIGSQLQGEGGATSVSFGVAVAVIMGIIATYVALGYVAGWAQTWLIGERERTREVSRQSWNRSVSESARRPGQSGLRPLETVFVVTTMLVTVAFWIWFAVLAGSPLPSQ